MYFEKRQPLRVNKNCLLPLCQIASEKSSIVIYSEIKFALIMNFCEEAQLAANDVEAHVRSASVLPKVALRCAVCNVVAERAE